MRKLPGGCSWTSRRFVANRRPAVRCRVTGWSPPRRCGDCLRPGWRAQTVSSGSRQDAAIDGEADGARLAAAAPGRRRRSRRAHVCGRGGSVCGRCGRPRRRRRLGSWPTRQGVLAGTDDVRVSTVGRIVGRHSAGPATCKVQVRLVRDVAGTATVRISPRRIRSSRLESLLDGIGNRRSCISRTRATCGVTMSGCDVHARWRSSRC